MKRLTIAVLLLAQGCATVPPVRQTPRITHKCSIVDRIEGGWAIIEAPDGVLYEIPAETMPGITEGAPLCALERIADLWEPDQLFDCLERGEDVNTCMTEEG